ncbi:MAG TPA: hypothetical protein VGO47_11620 [Chlamydiales bacterium]|nr:hypothetical protein [Chlamydiales bacterium]
MPLVAQPFRGKTRNEKDGEEKHAEQVNDECCYLQWGVEQINGGISECHEVPA